jgi:NADH-quinone oxidoreductase subunit E
MSVRRLADDAVQPQGFAFSAENLDWAQKKMAEYPPGRQQSAVIPVLFRAQEQEGWVSRPAIEAVAELLGMAYIRVLEVATFYTQFQLKPVGTRAHVQVCGTTPCMLRGAESIREVCEHRIHPHAQELNADGTLSWEEVECLGACVNAPLVMIGSDTYEDLTVESFNAILDKFAEGKGHEVKPGSQTGRLNAAPDGGRIVLLETPTTERTYKPFPPPPPPAAPAAPAPSAPAPAAAAPAPAAPSAPAPAAAAPASAAAPAAAAPKALFTAPAGAADNLKLISGVGPVMERNLNAVGITTWAQLAKLTPDQIAAVEGELGFKGRVARDRWIEQAEALAAGGVEEYIKRFGKDPR